MLSNKVQAYMSAHAMLPPSARVLVACSGGADSVALLRLLCELPGLTVVCAHFDHCLRGAESARDAAFVRALAERLGVEFRLGREDVAAFAKRNGLGLEEAARELRYRFLFRTAKETGCARIATAHTAGDNAETVLFHLIRGAGAAGLRGIRPVRPDGLIRPLLGVTRAELLDYLAALGQDWVEDSSNADTAYARNDLRANVLPALERINASAAEHICAAAETLAEDDDCLEALTAAFLETAYRDGALDIPALLEQPSAIALRALKRLCGDPGRAQLLRVLTLCRSGGPWDGLDLPGGLRVRRERELLRFGPEEPPPELPPRELVPGVWTDIPELGRRARLVPGAEAQEIHNSFNTFYFQSEKLCGKIFVTSRAEGDRIRLAGRGCTKELRRLQREAGLSPAERARALVIRDAAGIVAAEGFGVAERVAPGPDGPTGRVELEDIGGQCAKAQEKGEAHDKTDS